MSVDLDGVNDLVDFGSGSTIDDVWNTGGTVAFWLFWDIDDGGTNTGLGKTSSGNNSGWYCGVDGTNTNNHVFMVSRWTGSAVWRGPDGGILTGRWYHFAITYDDASTANDPVFYVDGVSVTVTESNTPSGSYTDDSANDLWIGQRRDGLQVFDGKIEDVRMYVGTTLTADQIAILASGIRTPMGGEDGWWSCNDFEGITHPDGTTLTAGTNLLHDLSPNDNTGDPTNGVIARASDAPRYINWPYWAHTGVIEEGIAGSMGTGQMQGTIAKQAQLPAAGAMGTGQMAGTIAKLIALPAAAAMGVSQMAGTIVKLIAVPLAGAMGTGQMAGAIQSQVRKVIYFLMDTSISADGVLDTSLVNTDDPEDRV